MKFKNIILLLLLNVASLSRAQETTSTCSPLHRAPIGPFKSFYCDQSPVFSGSHFLTGPVCQGIIGKDGTSDISFYIIIGNRAFFMTAKYGSAGLLGSGQLIYAGRLRADNTVICNFQNNFGQVMGGYVEQGFNSGGHRLIISLGFNDGTYSQILTGKLK